VEEERMGTSTGKTLAIGMDVGSTTVKAVVVNPANREILWSDYQRHHTKQPEKVLELLERSRGVPRAPARRVAHVPHGLGRSRRCAAHGGKFVQEVNAVTLAVENESTPTWSVIELGGQDAKIIMFKTDEKTGEKTASASMNDKCASGTGATIDKCIIKVGAARARDDAPLRRLEAPPRRRQVRRVRRDRHRQPGQERHPRRPRSSARSPTPSCCRT
jgi:activator of 2-hydroxyglutaryl-CoA dehydratase